MATITKRKDHWFVQVRLKDHKPIRKSFDTESKAIIWAANTETELKSGVYVDPREIFNTSLSVKNKSNIDIQTITNEDIITPQTLDIEEIMGENNRLTREVDILKEKLAKLTPTNLSKDQTVTNQ